jgi:all-trans-retinol dehydrogenase (NAD+)
LYDELCADDHDNYIFTTCVFPGFISTRKELTNVLEQSDQLGPLMTPSYAADEIVKSIRKNERSLLIPSSMRLLIEAK